MLQILTYLLSFYLVIKRLEALQIGLASNRPSRTGVITFGALVLAASVIAAIAFSAMQGHQAMSMSSGPSSTP